MEWGLSSLTANCIKSTIIYHLSTYCVPGSEVLLESQGCPQLHRPTAVISQLPALHTLPGWAAQTQPPCHLPHPFQTLQASFPEPETARDFSIRLQSPQPASDPSSHPVQHDLVLICKLFKTFPAPMIPPPNGSPHNEDSSFRFFPPHPRGGHQH